MPTKNNIKIYKHPWLGQYFVYKPRDSLEAQQTTFMTQLIGGPKIYAGQKPKEMHGHMMIAEELFDLQTQLLPEAIRQIGISDDLSDCTRQYAKQNILNFSKWDLVLNRLVF